MRVERDATRQLGTDIDVLEQTLAKMIQDGKESANKFVQLEADLLKRKSKSEVELPRVQMAEDKGKVEKNTSEEKTRA